LDIRDLSSIPNNKYDFISCFETLYYISQDNERERILIDIKNKGKDNCLYLFSIVTVGENKYRKYLTYSEGINFFKKHFQIIDCFPITIGKINLNFFQKFIRKILKFIFTKKETIKSYKKLLNRSNPEDAYQCIFILIKN
jgi:hypothetical protein